jgi:hypothetical protein
MCNCNNDNKVNINENNNEYEYFAEVSSTTNVFPKFQSNLIESDYSKWGIVNNQLAGATNDVPANNAPAVPANNAPDVPANNAPAVPANNAPAVPELGKTASNAAINVSELGKKVGDLGKTLGEPGEPGEPDTTIYSSSIIYNRSVSNIVCTIIALILFYSVWSNGRTTTIGNIFSIFVILCCPCCYMCYFIVHKIAK